MNYSALSYTVFPGKSVSLHIATPVTSQRKLWIYDDPGGKDWFNSDFRRIYATAYEALYKEDRKYFTNIWGSCVSTVVQPLIWPEI